MASIALVSRDRLIKESPLQKMITKYRWELFLIVIFILVSGLFSHLTPYYLDSFNLMNATFQFSEKAILALPMVFIIMCGDIDISVSSMIALSAFAMGTAAEKGASIPQIVLLGIAIGTLCGFINGMFITLLRMPSIAVTLATSSIFRGIAKGVLTEHACTTYPKGFGFFGQSFIGESIIPFEFVLYLVIALVFAFILHKTIYGRHLYAIGNSAEAALFSGVDVRRVKVINFTLMGFMSGLAAVLLASRILSVRSNIADGWDMEVIMLVVLGGVCITGGSGTIGGVIISSLLVGYMKFGMGLLKFSGTTMTIVTGGLLIIAVLMPQVFDYIEFKKGEKKR